MATYTGHCYAGHHALCRYPEDPFASCDCECHDQKGSSKG